MVINNYKPGQLCNRLWHFSHFIANAIEYDHRLVYTAMGDYAQFFESTAKNNFCGYKITSRFSRSNSFNSFLIRFMVKYCERFLFALKVRSINIPFIKSYIIESTYDVHNKIFRMDNPVFVREAGSNITFVRGWQFKDKMNLLKHAEIIREFFKPVAPYEKNAIELIQACRKKGEVIIGIHIRRGDYKEFENGKWFYGDCIYFQKMKEMEFIINRKGKQPTFLICSNEPLNIESFKGVSSSFAQRHFMVDLCALSMCDFILGPPSSFSCWASFYGKVPLCILESKDKEVNLDDFIIYPGKLNAY